MYRQRFGKPKTVSIKTARKVRQSIIRITAVATVATIITTRSISTPLAASNRLRLPISMGCWVQCFKHDLSNCIRAGVCELTDLTHSRPFNQPRQEEMDSNMSTPKIEYRAEADNRKELLQDVQLFWQELCHICQTSMGVIPALLQIRRLSLSRCAEAIHPSRF